MKQQTLLYISDMLMLFMLSNLLYLLYYVFTGYYNFVDVLASTCFAFVFNVLCKCVYRKIVRRR